MGVSSSLIAGRVVAPRLVAGAASAAGGAVSVILQEDGGALLLEAGGDVERDTSIPAQDAAAALTGGEYVALVQGGTTKRALVATVVRFLRGY